MTLPTKFSSIAVLTILAFILSACGAPSNQTQIATYVAMTVQAEHTQAAKTTPTQPSLATLPPAVLPTLTSVVTKAPPTAPASGGQLCSASASFVSETIPDGTITSPGAVFTKTWRIKNTGTCPWNSTWQFVYMSGDLMGAALYYNLPGVVAPGDTLSMPIVLTAPADGGSYRGYWKIKSPWGLVFGDSGSGNSFWVDIQVGGGTPANNRTQTAFDVTAVSYETDVTMIRRCTAANTFYSYIAYITTNGPLTVSYRFYQSDGNNSNHGTVTFDSAATKSVSGEWSQNRQSSTNERWIKLVITSPVNHEYPQFTLPPLCP